MKERTGAREGDTRRVREPSVSPRVSPSRAPVFSCARFLDKRYYSCFELEGTNKNGSIVLPSNLTIHVLQHQFHQGIPDDVADERKLGYSSLRPHSTHLLVIQDSILKGNFEQVGA